MASNHTQININDPNRSGSLPPSINDSHSVEQKPDRSQEITPFSRRDGLNPTNSNLKRQRIINDAQIIRNRRIYFNQKSKRELEHRCEEKVSKYRLEQAHTSVPSSIRSTFIMTFSPDGKRVASTHGDHRIYICDLNTGELLDTLEGHPKTPWCLAWHPSKKEILASGCLAGEVRVWDLNAKGCQSWISDNNSIITSLDFHPKERILVIATANDVLFWDWNEFEPFAKTTTIHEREKVKFVVFDSSGTKLITGISNLPKYAGYSSDSLQSRIIDGYLSPRSIEITAENMTQNSEITLNQNNNSTFSESNENLNQLETETLHGSNSSSGNIGGDGGSRAETNEMGGSLGNNEQDVNNRNTLVLSRIAMLYRQLEALEDSIRHTSFNPIVNVKPDQPAVECVDERNNSSQPQPSNIDSRTSNPQEESDTTNEASSSSMSRNHGEVTQCRQDTNVEQSPHDEQLPTSNTFEPYLVTFDESLEQLQLPPLVVDGRIVNLVNVIEQYPLDISYQLNYAMQFESINQVNQNFIRISKLMSSARLYRQIVQQILSSNSGSGPHHQNQILTVQSVSSRSQRNSPNLPIVLRNFQMGSLFSSTGLHRARSTDPIMAIQFRNSARNVPLATICKIDLLAARAVCIMRSQVLVEQALRDNQLSTTDSQPQSVDLTNNESFDESSSYRTILNQLHGILTQINHAPLTTSNAYTHVTSLRMTIDRLLKALSKVLNMSPESRRLVSLIHNVAFSLTGRKWSVPLGASLEEIRLDVIHTLYIVDLALHLARQIQLLQMQRISLLARVADSRRSSETAESGQSHIRSSTLNQLTSSNESNPHLISAAAPSSAVARNKRKNSPCSSSSRRKKLSYQMNATSRPGSSAVEEINAPNTTSEGINGNNTNNNSHTDFQQNEMLNSQSNVMVDQVPPNDRLLLWNNPQNQLEQSLQRFLLATSPNTNNRHILVRIYHRLHGSNQYPNQGSSLVPDQLIERATTAHHESRRRALSQDHSAEIHDVPMHANSSTSSNSINSNPSRSRIRAPTAFQVNIAPGQNNYHQHQHIPAGMVIYPWMRHSHLQVYHARGPGQHLWFNQWAVPLPLNSSNYRLQCWDFSPTAIPNIKDSQCNIITAKCRIHNDSSVDISRDGTVIACLVPREDPPSCLPSFDLKIFSLKTHDFGTCYYRLPHGFNAVSVSLSPSAMFAVVGLMSHKFINPNSDEDDLTIAKVYRLRMRGMFESVRDVKIKRTDTSLSLNAIRWMSHGIVYNVGPQLHQRYRMRNMMAP